MVLTEVLGFWGQVVRFGWKGKQAKKSLERKECECVRVSGREGEDDYECDFLSQSGVKVEAEPQAEPPGLSGGTWRLLEQDVGREPGSLG